MNLTCVTTVISVSDTDLAVSNGDIIFDRIVWNHNETVRKFIKTNF